MTRDDRKKIEAYARVVGAARRVLDSTTTPEGFPIPMTDGAAFAELRRSLAAFDAAFGVDAATMAERYGAEVEESRRAPPASDAGRVSGEAAPDARLREALDMVLPDWLPTDLAGIHRTLTDCLSEFAMRMARAQDVRATLAPAPDARVEALGDALRRIVANDRTIYRHHEARPSDGKRPSEVDGGSIFLTPAEIASAALLFLAPRPLPSHPVAETAKPRRCGTCASATPWEGGRRVHCKQGHGYGIDAAWGCEDWTAERAPSPSAESAGSLCGDVHPLGFECGRPRGHDGHHRSTALGCAWFTVGAPPPESKGDGSEEGGR